MFPITYEKLVKLSIKKAYGISEKNIQVTWLYFYINALYQYISIFNNLCKNNIRLALNLLVNVLQLNFWYTFYVAYHTFRLKLIIYKPLKN